MAGSFWVEKYGVGVVARLAVNALHLKLAGRLRQKKTTTKSNSADRRWLEWGLWRGIQRVYRSGLALLLALATLHGRDGATERGPLILRLRCQRMPD
ncbi:hypothetical protein [Pseudomonas fulva]|uniref:hypothetical protein n=1 Tax=Pseudomonas fulva TaxID=47880 RepID=UPI0018AA6961|nr:hypothetical protein [Pseudomonas fulva]MBF8777753.1 hypothetical protein [Pseudomonas fulva]